MPSQDQSYSDRTLFSSDPRFMQRCLDLALLGSGRSAPNPLVGAVLVHEGKIIGEGYHEQWGGPHAEVNCLQSVKIQDEGLISGSTLYVSLEPCCHFGKTPPCTDLILHKKIPHVVVGCRDPFSEVDGRGIEKLKRHGVRVDFPVMENEAREINRRFFTFHQKKRPYFILKWAQSADLKIAGPSGQKIQISNSYSNRLVHKWRTEESGILVGTNTALLDNPALTSRLWPGKNPTRIVIDKRLRLPDSLHLFDGSVSTVILNEQTDLSAGNRLFKHVSGNTFDIPAIAESIYSLDILSVMVEGGTTLLNSFLQVGMWDEMRVITNTGLTIPGGIPAPDIKETNPVESLHYESDSIQVYRK